MDFKKACRFSEGFLFCVLSVPYYIASPENAVLRISLTNFKCFIYSNLNAEVITFTNFTIIKEVLYHDSAINLIGAVFLKTTLAFCGKIGGNSTAVVLEVPVKMLQDFLMVLTLFFIQRK